MLSPQQFPVAQLQLKPSFLKEETTRLQTDFPTWKKQSLQISIWTTTTKVVLKKGKYSTMSLPASENW